MGFSDLSKHTELLQTYAELTDKVRVALEAHDDIKDRAYSPHNSKEVIATLLDLHIWMLCRMKSLQEAVFELQEQSRVPA